MWQAEPLFDCSGVEYKTWTKNSDNLAEVIRTFGIFLHLKLILHPFLHHPFEMLKKEKKILRYIYKVSHCSRNDMLAEHWLNTQHWASGCWPRTRGTLYLLAFMITLGIPYPTTRRWSYCPTKPNSSNCLLDKLAFAFAPHNTCRRPTHKETENICQGLITKRGLNWFKAKMQFTGWVRN